MYKAAVLSPFFLAAAAQGGIAIDFTPGALPSLTFAQSFQLTITDATSAGSYILLGIKNASPTPGTQTIAMLAGGNPAFTINGSGNYHFAGWVDEGYSSLDITAKESYFFVQLPVALSIGDVVTIGAGTYATSSANTGFNVPADGTYDIALYSAATGTSGKLISGLATPVPEPSTYGLMLGGLALAVAACRRRKRSE